MPHSLPPPAQSPLQPSYILRGHTAQIHSLHFSHSNLRLLSGDADGWLVIWDTALKRPLAVWKAHETTILGVQPWGGDRIITHGRDNKLKVWHLPACNGAEAWENAGFSPLLPLEDAAAQRKMPGLLHSLRVNALNFCAFASAAPPAPSARPNTQTSEPPGHSPNNAAPATPTTKPPTPTLLLATPGLEDGHIALTALPSERRVATILPPAAATPKTGLLMAVALSYPSSSDTPDTAAASAPLPRVFAGYESGHVAVFAPVAAAGPSAAYGTVYLRQPHAQPVLSLALAAGRGCWVSSAADAVVARHYSGFDARSLCADSSDTTAALETEPPVLTLTRHAGQQGLAVRDDERVFATAGWDGRVRVYAVGHGGHGKGKGKERRKGEVQELACLKWHGTGVYAVAFAGVARVSDPRVDGAKTRSTEVGDDERDEHDGGPRELSLPRRTLTVAEQRVENAKKTHWLAAGGKDGKISLWDVY